MNKLLQTVLLTIFFAVSFVKADLKVYEVTDETFSFEKDCEIVSGTVTSKCPHSILLLNFLL